VPMPGHSSVAEVEVVASTRRRWSEAERWTILAEADQSVVTVSEIGRRHGLSPSLLFRWRWELAKSKKGAVPEPVFVPLALPAPVLSPAKPAGYSPRTPSGVSKVCTRS